ncbi:hypothetical protein BDD12DRAFT_170729 [Trichophaea hybrida]|nr:hypothetical protein BDD12DRAFT_170729 [Trichophaea hybrida]
MYLYDAKTSKCCSLSSKSTSPPKCAACPQTCCSHLQLRLSPSPPPASQWKMDFPLPSLLCEAHLVRRRSIAAAEAFGHCVWLVAGGQFVSGKAARSAPPPLAPAVSIVPVIVAVWGYVTTVQAVVVVVAVVVVAVIVIKPSGQVAVTVGTVGTVVSFEAVTKLQPARNLSLYSSHK